ncbi:MAG: sigma-54-dependent Fis family transcriptional regulator [Treponema sp.]|nr:sigma-54-dependent Fis family transcriptional regulator [Treponema sp.]
MNQFSFDYMKTLIEISKELNSDFSNRDALLFKILKAAMRFVKCDAACYVVTLPGVNPFKVVSIVQDGVYKTLDKELSTSSIAFYASEKKQPLFYNSVADNSDYFKFVAYLEPTVVDNLIAIPVYVDGKITCVIECMNRNDGFEFSEEDVEVCKLFADVIASVLINFNRYESEISTEGKSKHSQTVLLHDFVAESPVVLDLMKMVKKVAQTNSSVLITGESGVGKELFAEQIYLNSRRKGKPFIRVNCAALSQTLMESELFGHEKGAFTSADSMQQGRFELADGGTIFLDEVGEIPLALQAKLLRVIQDKQFERVGSSTTMTVDVRIIAATNRNLEEMVRQGKFREDLFFRLNVLPVRVPPLRNRVEDILPLANLFLRKASADCCKTVVGFSTEARQALKMYSWPGNVRELDNVISRACVVAEEDFIKKEDLDLSFNSFVSVPGNSGTDIVHFLGIDDGDKSLKNALYLFKRSYLLSILDECKWNQTKAAMMLGIQRTYVSRLMNELHIRENKTDL